MNGWSLDDYLTMPAEYKPVVLELIEEHNREARRQANRGR